MSDANSNDNKDEKEIKQSFKTFPFSGMALDPIHVGTGATCLGSVDNTIVRDPVTKIPKVPGSSIAGVMRAYTAMAVEKYPECAGMGQPKQDGTGGHCGKADCPVCTVFGFAKAKDSKDGFAGLAGFSDMHVLLFPVASQLGPQWITSPMVLQLLHDDSLEDLISLTSEDAVYREGKEEVGYLNLGWLNLPVKTDLRQLGEIAKKIEALGIPGYIISRMGVVSDKLFPHIVNSNLEVRTSVAIDPATGAAEDRALFTYEAMPRGTVLFWKVTCKDPKHFKINQTCITAVNSPDEVRDVVTKAYPYLEHLGIGGMGTRGLGRLRVF